MRIRNPEIEQIRQRYAAIVTRGVNPERSDMCCWLDTMFGYIAELERKQCGCSETTSAAKIRMAIAILKKGPFTLHWDDCCKDALSILQADAERIAEIRDIERAAGIA